MDPARPVFERANLTVYPDRVQTAGKSYLTRSISAVEATPPSGWTFFGLSLLLTAATLAFPICLPVALIINVYAFVVRRNYEVQITTDGQTATILKTPDEELAQSAEQAVLSVI